MRRLVVVGVLVTAVGVGPTVALALPAEAVPGPSVAAATSMALAPQTAARTALRKNRVITPVNVLPGESITITGRQNYGRGRLISLQRWAKGAGWVKTRWTRTNASFTYRATVPKNATGTITYRVRVSVTKKVKKRVKGKVRLVKRTRVHTVEKRIVPVLKQSAKLTSTPPRAGAKATLKAAVPVVRAGRPVRLEEYRNGGWVSVKSGIQSSAAVSLTATLAGYPAWYRVTAPAWKGIKQISSAPVLSVLARRPVGVSHRAGTGVRPENTLPALEAAIAEKPEAIEFDVQIAKDGELFVLHDRTLTRTTDMASRWPQYATNWATDFRYHRQVPSAENPDVDDNGDLLEPDAPVLSELDAGYFKGVKVSPDVPSPPPTDPSDPDSEPQEQPVLPYRIPTLDEWVETNAGRVTLQLEVKYSGSGPNVAVWDELEKRLQPGENLDVLNRQGKLLVTAFESARVEAFKLQHPEVPVAMVTEQAPADFTVLQWLVTPETKGYLNMNFRKNGPEAYTAARAQGYTTSAWTARTLADHRKAIATGADRIVSDDLSLLDAALNPPRPR